MVTVNSKYALIRGRIVSAARSVSKAKVIGVGIVLLLIINSVWENHVEKVESAESKEKAAVILDAILAFNETVWKNSKTDWKKCPTNEKENALLNQAADKVPVKDVALDYMIENYVEICRREARYRKEALEFIERTLNGEYAAETAKEKAARRKKEMEAERKDKAGLMDPAYENFRKRTDEVADPMKGVIGRLKKISDAAKVKNAAEDK